MTDRVVRARWWTVVALLLGIQADVAPLQHADSPEAHQVYTVLSVAAWLVVVALLARPTEEAR
jgi:hypothetical protein